MTDNSSRKRKVEGYQPDYDLDSDYGRQGEFFVADVADAIKSGLVEVKRDGQWHRHQNLYVERTCRKVSGAWEPSGIKTTKATMWAFVLGDTEVMFAVPTGLLLQYCEEKWATGNRNRKRNGRNLYELECSVGSHPTTGFKLHLPEFLCWLAKRQAAA